MLDVFIVEDDQDFLVLLNRVLAKTKKVRIVGSSPTAEEALREIPRHNPDVLLMDIDVPGIAECVLLLKKLAPLSSANVLLLIGDEDSELVFESLKAGADGYLLKERIAVRQLSTVIRDLHSENGIGRPQRIGARKKEIFEEQAQLCDEPRAAPPRPGPKNQE